MVIDQSGKKLSGTWDSAFSGGTTSFTGSVTSKGKVTFNLEVSGKCHLNAVGLLVKSNEISCTYKVESCKVSKGDHGTFDITR